MYKYVSDLFRNRGGKIVSEMGIWDLPIHEWL